MLRPSDAAVLAERELRHEVTPAGGFTLLQVLDYPVGSALLPERSTLLLQLPAGFPDATPDMFWFDPPLQRRDGTAIPGTEVRQQIDGRTWQRWSRHIQGQWRPGVDNLGTYLAYVRRCLDQAGGRG
jgi:hypothetical protein